MGTASSTPDGEITAAQFLHFLVHNQIDSPKIYEILCVPVNTARYQTLIARIDRVNAAARPKGQNKQAWEGRKNEIKGTLFEMLIGIVLESVEPFASWANVNTTTSEIDWLVQIGPSGAAVPALREWGTHFLCECKLSHDYISIQWITNLATSLQTHNANIGVLFTTRGLSNRGNGIRARHQIDALSVMAPARFIVCITAEDLHLCATGFNFLRLISQRYMEAKAHSGRLKLLQT